MIKDLLTHWHSEKMIVLYLAGGLPVGQRWAFENHLSKCEKCRELLRREQQFNQDVFSACAPLGSALQRTRARMEKLPNYYGAPIHIPVRKKKGKPVWQFWNWQVPPSFAVMIVAIAILYLAGEYFSISHFVVPLGTQEFSGQVTRSLGEGLWLQAFRSNDWHKVNVNTELHPGDKIRVDEYGRGLITWGKNCQIWLNHASQISLMSNVNTAFEVTHGEVYIALNQHHGLFQVKTPAGVVRVYGTQFQISVDPAIKKTSVYCFQNTVYFDNPQGEAVLPAGYKSEANPQTKPSEPALFDLAQMVYWKTQFDQLSLLSEKERKQLHQSFVEQGDMYFDDRDYDKALNLYKTAVILDPNDYIPYYGIGRVYRELGQYELATSFYMKMIERNPNEYAANYQLALCLMELKQYRDAELILHHAIEKHPSNQTEWIMLGNIYVLEHSPDKAERAFNEALKLGEEISGDSYSQVHGGLAEIARQRGDYDTAVGEITKALQSKTVPGLVYAEAAWVYRENKNPKNEKSAWENYLKLDPHGSFEEDAHKRIKQIDSL